MPARAAGTAGTVSGSEAVGLLEAILKEKQDQVPQEVTRVKVAKVTHPTFRLASESGCVFLFDSQ